MPVWRICLIVVLRLDGQFNFSSLPPSHRIACGEIVVEEVEKKQCWKCKGHKALEMFRGDIATCNGCLAHRKNGQGIIQKKLGRSGVAEIRGGT